jgi:glucose/arabinose dehydrogenase
MNLPAHLPGGFFYCLYLPLPMCLGYGIVVKIPIYCRINDINIKTLKLQVMGKFVQKKIRTLGMLLFCFVAVEAVSQSPDVKIGSVAVISGLTNAMQLVHAGDGSGRIFVAERAGVIKVFEAGALGTPILFLDMNSAEEVVDDAGEGGLLSVAFHPDFATNGYFFTYHTNPAGDLVVARYTATPASGDSANVASRLEILTIPHPTYSNHNGGEMHFGYDDGYLYLSTGDGGSSNDPSGNAQNEDVLLGKILRIDIDAPDGSPTPYQVPATNPDPTSLVYARGLRNPFRWSFDRLTHAIWIGDVGQGAREEVNFVTAAALPGANFGWRCFEGEIETPGIADRTGCPVQSATVAPVYTYPTGDLRGRSVIGGVMYRGTASPLMYGYYIGTDYSTGQIHKIKEDGTSEPYQSSGVTGIADIGEDENGEIYAVTGSAIYGIYATEALPVKLVSFSGAPAVEGVKLTWKTSMEENSQAFDVEHSDNSVTFETIGTVLSQNSLSGGNYTFTHVTSSKGTNYYRLKMIDTDGTSEYSRIIATGKGPERVVENFIRPSLITDQHLNLVLDEPFQSVELVGIGGQVFWKEDIAGRSGHINLPLHRTSSGIYIVRLADNDRVVQQKVLVMER